MAKKKGGLKIRLNFKCPPDLAEWVRKYANDKNTTVTQIIVDHFSALRKDVDNVPQF